MKLLVLELVLVVLLTSCVTETDLDGTPIPFFSNIHVLEIPIFDENQREGREKSIKVVSSLAAAPTDPNLLSEFVFLTSELKYNIDAKARYQDQTFLYKAILTGELVTKDQGSARETRLLRTLEATGKAGIAAAYSFPRKVTLPYEMPGGPLLPPNTTVVLGRERPGLLREELSVYHYLADRSSRIEIRSPEGSPLAYLDGAGIHIKKSADGEVTGRALGFLLLCTAVREELFFELEASRTPGH